jgi:hypothetical protein
MDPSTVQADHAAQLSDANAHKVFMRAHEELLILPKFHSLKMIYDALTKGDIRVIHYCKAMMSYASDIDDTESYYVTLIALIYNYLRYVMRSGVTNEYTDDIVTWFVSKWRRYEKKSSSPAGTMFERSRKSIIDFGNQQMKTLSEREINYIGGYLNVGGKKGDPPNPSIAWKFIRMSLRYQTKDAALTLLSQLEEKEIDITQLYALYSASESPMIFMRRLVDLTEKKAVGECNDQSPTITGTFSHTMALRMTENVYWMEKDPDPTLAFLSYWLYVGARFASCDVKQDGNPVDVFGSATRSFVRAYNMVWACSNEPAQSKRIDEALLSHRDENAVVESHRVAFRRSRVEILCCLKYRELEYFSTQRTPKEIRIGRKIFACIHKPLPFITKGDVDHMMEWLKMKDERFRLYILYRARLTCLFLISHELSETLLDRQMRQALTLTKNKRKDEVDERVRALETMKEMRESGADQLAALNASSGSGSSCSSSSGSSNE